MCPLSFPYEDLEIVAAVDAGWVVPRKEPAAGGTPC